MSSLQERATLVTLLKSLAKRLAIPAKAGVYISVPDLRVIASKLDLPLTVREDRRWVIEELLKTAYDYEKLDVLCDELKRLILNRLEKLESIAAMYPASMKLLDDPRRSAEETIERIERLKKEYLSRVKNEGRL